MTNKTHCQACGSTDYEDIMFTEEFEGYSTCCNEIVVGRCVLGVCYHD